MLDAALLALLDSPPLPPAIPAVAAEVREYRSPADEEGERRLKRLANAFAQQSDAFKARTRELVLSVEHSAPTWANEDIPQLSALVADIEAIAEQRARESARTEKQQRRLNKKMFANFPATGAMYRTYVDQMIAIDRANVEEMLSFALFLRAFIADRSPDSRGGPVFDNADDLAKHLDALVA